MRKFFCIGLIAGFMLLGCAGWAYKFYGMEGVVYEHGTLLGPKPQYDLPFTKCQPNGESKQPCIVIFSKDFYALKQEFLDLQMRLKECEKGK